MNHLLLKTMFTATLDTEEPLMELEPEPLSELEPLLEPLLEPELEPMLRVLKFPFSVPLFHPRILQ